MLIPSEKPTMTDNFAKKGHSSSVGLAAICNPSPYLLHPFFSPLKRIPSCSDHWVILGLEDYQVPQHSNVGNL